jgi:hypothetical protein
MGLFILTVAAGPPSAGLPEVQLFDRPMFENVTQPWQALHIEQFEDVGCTNRQDYRIWYGEFQKSQVNVDPIKSTPLDKKNHRKI